MLRFVPRLLLAVALLVTAAAASAAALAPAERALAALREMRVLNYRIQTAFHTAALAGTDTRPVDALHRDVARFDTLAAVLRVASREGRLRIAIDDVDVRWEAMRWFTANDLPVPTGELQPKEIAYDRARHPASIAAMKAAGQQLAATLVQAMMVVPGPQEPQSNVDFALAALELQYLAYRYVDLAGIDPITDDTGEPRLETLEGAFQQRLRQLVNRYGTDAQWQAPLAELDTAWRFVQPALSRAQEAPTPILVSIYIGNASDALRPAFSALD